MGEVIKLWRHRLGQAWQRVATAFAAKPWLQRTAAGMYLFGILIYLISANQATLAAGSWTQTDWSGGVGSSTSNQYISANSLDTSQSGSFGLSSTEELTNTTFDTNTTEWDGTVSQATPAFVQTQKIRLSANDTTLTATLPQTPVAGNTLILAVSFIGIYSGTVNPPAGYTTDMTYQPTSRPDLRIFRKVAGAGESQSLTVTLTGAATLYQIDILEISGIATTSPLDRTSVTSSTSQSATSLDIPATSTTSQSKEMAIAFVGNNGGANAHTFSNDFVRTNQPNGNIAAIAYKPLTSTGAVSTSTTWTVSRSAAGVILTYKAQQLLTATQDTGIKHSGTGSAKLVASSAGDGVFIQRVNTGGTNNHNLTGYVYTTGAAVTSADAVLYANDTPLSTSYTSVGSGWYRLSASTAGSASETTYGVQVKAGKTVYFDDASLSSYTTSGTLVSNIYDTGTISNWGNLTYSTTGSGTVSVRARSSNSASMAGAPNFNTCSAVSSASDLSSGTNGCVNDVERYIQYEVTLSTSNTAQSPQFDQITIDYTDADNTPPTTNASNIEMFRSDGGSQYSEGDWVNTSTPFFSWTAGEDDEPNGSGLAGYCLYLGQDETGNPITSKGLLGTSPVDSAGACQFVVNATELDLSQVNYLGSQLTTSDDPYYLNIKAIDNVGNVFNTGSASFNFKYDNTPPNNPAYITAPSNFINTKTATLTWATEDDDAASDENSGLAGLQYRVGSNGTWYGDSHNGNEDNSDLLTNDGSYSTQNNPDFANLVDGNNVIYFRSWDNAGNVTTATVTTVLKINTGGAPSSPRNIIATPSTNTQNSFAFSWIAPASFVGQASNLTYCYTVNTQPTAQTCTFTAAGVTSVPAGAFATQPGSNTFYVVAKDESGGINYATAASVDFTANTSAPGIPLSLDIADTSVKATSNWRLVISWEEPDDVGAGVAKYNVMRSTNGSSYSLAGSTSGSSYVDTNLQSQEYYYKVQACDSANNCGAFSNVETKTPTGRFTTAPELSDNPVVQSIGTRKATVKWATDRRSDSKIAFGTSSGNYQSTEAYNSSQVSSHSVELTNLNPGTTYYYVAKWTDEDGNTGQSNELTFATLPPPVVEDATVPVVELTRATVQYTLTGAHAIKLYYGKSSGFGGVIELNTSANRSTYNSDITGLDDGTKYFYKINTFDADGNEYDGTTLSFTTPPAPKITNLQFQPIENEPSSSQRVSWDTNVPSTSELAYGVSGLTETSISSALATKHELVIRGLKDDSVYRLIARSRDEAGNLAVSDEQSFKTALDTRPPQVSDVVVDAAIRGTGAEARGQIVVSWRTDEPSTSQVAYGEGGGALSSTTSEDSRLTYEHVVVVSNLATSKVYYVEPRSFDTARNRSSGEQQVAIIGRASDNVLSIIFNALQQLFGVN